MPMLCACAPTKPFRETLELFRRLGGNMRRVIRVVVGAALCFALSDYWDPAVSQQPIAPEAFRPAICDQLNIDGRASARYAR